MIVLKVDTDTEHTLSQEHKEAFRRNRQVIPSRLYTPRIILGEFDPSENIGSKGYEIQRSLLEKVLPPVILLGEQQIIELPF